jgi:LysM repeat protein
MKSLLVLLVLGALGFGGWYAWSHHRTAAAEPTDGPSLAPANGTNPAGGLGSSPVLQPQAVLPPEAQQAIEAGDALWNAAGATPATTAKAAEMNRLYSKALRALYNRPGAREREEQLITERLTPLGDQLFFSKAAVPADDQWETHTVSSGESPEAIAKKYGISRELLNRFRGRDVNDSKLRVGDSFKVIKLAGQTDPEKRGYFLHIDKGDYYLDCFVGGMFARRYVCSHGAANSPTPTGKTHVFNRVWHPDWTHPITHQVIPYGNPDHLLGPIWLPFDGKELGRSGIGIHGYTGADAKWGAQVSNGCIRLQNDKAEELYQTLCHPDRSPIGVEITD